MDFNAIKGLLLPSLVTQIAYFLGKQNTVSSKIEVVPVRASRGAFPVDVSDIAYDLSNNYGGSIEQILQGKIPNPEGVDFKLVEEKFYAGVTQDFIEELSIFYDDGSANKGEAIVNTIAQKMANRIGLIRERNLYKAVSDDGLYTATNTVDMTAKAITDWAESDIDELFGNIGELANYINKATGGSVFTDDVKIAEGQRLHVVLPLKVWLAFKGKSSIFNKFMTAYGIEGTDSRYITPKLFEDVTGGGTVSVATAFAKDPSKMGDTYKIANMVDIFDDSNIYMFTSNNDIASPSSIKEAVFVDQDVRDLQLLDNRIYSSRTKRMTVQTNPMAFAKIELKLS